MNFLHRLAKLFAPAFLMAACLVGGAPAQAQPGSIAVTNAWARPTVTGQRYGGGFMRIENRGAADRLLEISSPQASMVEIHRMVTENDIMVMRPVDALDIPAGKTVELGPGGLHLMLMGLKAPLAEGTSVPVKLRFEKAGEVQVQMKVMIAAPAAASRDDHKH